MIQRWSDGSPEGGAVSVTQDATREYVSDSSALPVVNQRVQVQLSTEADTDQASTGVPSRIEDVVYVTGKRPYYEIFFAPPRYGGDVEPPRPGHAMAIVWSTTRGVLELPVEFVDVQRVGEVVSAWRVRVTGAAVRVQRRHFVRVAFVTPIVVSLDRPEDDEGAAPDAGSGEPVPSVPVQVDPVQVDPVQVVPVQVVPAQASPAEPVTVEGFTADVSEGGLRCVLAEELAGETPVHVSFAFGTDRFRLEARIVRAFAHAERPGYQGEPRWDTAVRFVDPDLAADALRKCIFAEQMRLRRETGR
jgi:hypothetical protein